LRAVQFSQAGRGGGNVGSSRTEEIGLGCRRLVVIGIEQSLSLKQDAGDIEESVGDPANGAAVGVAALA
jgi:hypothetical protein